MDKIVVTCPFIASIVHDTFTFRAIGFYKYEEHLIGGLIANSGKLQLLSVDVDETMHETFGKILFCVKLQPIIKYLKFLCNWGRLYKKEIKVNYD